MFVTSRNSKQFQYIVILGVILLVIGMFIAVRYALLCRGDIDIYQLGDFALVIAGISIQLLGLGLIIIWKK
jgi:hypothetical protein